MIIYIYKPFEMEHNMTKLHILAPVLWKMPVNACVRSP